MHLTQVISNSAYTKQLNNGHLVTHKNHVSQLNLNMNVSIITVSVHLSSLFPLSPSRYVFLMISLPLFVEHLL